MTFPVNDLPRRLQPCIVGIGETRYTRRGGHNDTPELKLCIEAIRAAAADATIDPREIEGFSSFGFERHEPAVVQTRTQLSGGELKPGPAGAAVIAALRDVVGGPGPDRFLSPELEAADALVASGQIRAAAESAVGNLA